MTVRNAILPRRKGDSLPNRPALTLGLVLVSDILALLSLMAFSIWVRSRFEGLVGLEYYLSLWPVLLLFPLAYAFMGLYPGVLLNPPEEIRRLALGTTLVYLFLGATTFLAKDPAPYSRAIFLGAWALSLVGVPLARAVLRHLFAGHGWWGYPVVVLGAGQAGASAIQALRDHAGIGLKPVAVLDDRAEVAEVEGVPVLGHTDLAERLASEWHIRHAILATPGASRAEMLDAIEKHGSVFPHLTLIPDLFGMASLWVTPLDLGGVLGLNVRNNLLRLWDRRLKRGLDLLGVAVLGVLALPVLGLAALWIRLDSPGPALYVQERLGRDGRRFRVLKFRTMHGDGERRLAELLATRPELREEYERYHKLKTDPRVTRAGAILRRTSLDELPQLWNVLKGEMSLVGPRPYLPRELEKLAGSERLILKAPPGLTGMWQVSGRNGTSFHERIGMDIYYVRNWSPWLDLYLLARTVWVMVWGRGAY